MVRTLSENLNEYASAFRDLVNEKVLVGSSESVKALLRLNKEEDWDFIVSSMDIIDDVSSALDNFLKFGLDGPSRYDDVGERYLRLYGVLNATYLQQQAVLHLYKLMSLPELRQAKNKVNDLRIRVVRHKVGAHGVDYINPTSKKVESFVPIRVSLSGFNLEYINNENRVAERIDLKKCIEEHFELLQDFLDKIYEKAFKTFYKGNKKKIEEHAAKLKDLRIVKKGGLVLRLPQGGKLIIHAMR